MRKIFYRLIGFIIILSISRIDAQVFDPATIPENYGSTHYGTDFWLTFHPNYQTQGTSNSIRIYVTSLVETSVKVEIPGKGYQTQMNTIPYNPIQFDIPVTVGQPFSGNMSTPPPIEQVYDGAAIHVTSQDPIVVYGLARGSGSSDGYMAIPKTAWGKEYLISSWADISNNSTEYLPSYVSVIAGYDNTKVSVTLGGSAGTETTGGMKIGDFRQFTLYSGDVLVIPSSLKYSDLSGTKITGNKPITVVSGNRCTFIPETQSNCDYLAEMEIPTQLWGKEFHVGPINKRKKNPIIKIFPKLEGTTIYKNGIEIASLKLAGGLEGDGWLRIRTDNGNPIPVTIRGDKPISVTLFNTSRSEDTVSIDPFQMLQIPIEQYQREVFFSTPSAKNYIEFPTNYINIIYESSPQGVVPDDLEIGKEINGKLEWTRINVNSPLPGDPFGLASNGKRYFFKSYQLPTFGSYKVRANNPIMVYSYGYNANSSYGYPASSNLINLEKNLDTMGPVLTYSVGCDGSVINGIVEDMPKNNDRSYLSVVCFHNHDSYNYDFSYNDFVPGEKDKTNWNLEVKDSKKDARAIITFADRTGHDTTVVINYFVRKPAINPGLINLGLHKIGDTLVSDFWLLNQSTSSSLVLNNVFLKNGDRGFELLDNDLEKLSFPITLLPNDSVNIKIRFIGVKKGVYSDSIGFSDDCYTWILGSISTETGQPKIAVSDYNFPDTYLLSQSMGQIVIRNEGNYYLSITDYIPLSESAFKLDIQEISESNPLVLGPGQYFTFEATFEPTLEKDYIDSVVFVSDAIETDPKAILSGKGIIRTGVDENADIRSSMTLYPNPADGKLLINLKGISAQSNIRVFDFLGNIITEKSIESMDNESNFTLDVSNLTNGMYFIILNSSVGIIKSSFNILR